MIGTLFLVSAPSGAGKTTIVNATLQQLKKSYWIEQVVTYTTRAMRSGEVEGKDYFFITVEEFKAKIAANFFMEWSTWYENYYGSPASIIKDVQKGKSYIAIVDRFGAQAIKKLYPLSVLIWIEPISIAVLRERLVKRGGASMEAIESRLSKAVIEMAEEKEKNFYKYHIINDDFHKTIEKTLNCIVGAISKK